MQEIILQVYPRGVNPIVQVSQYDKGRNLLLKLYEGSTAYDIPEGCDVLFEGQKPDGTVFSYQAAYDDNLVTLSLEQQVTLVAGRVTCEIRIINGDSVNIGTINFTMYVEASPVDSDDDISETEIPALIDLGQQYAQRAETAAERAEADALTAENAANTAQSVYESIPLDYDSLSESVEDSAENIQKIKVAFGEPYLESLNLPVTLGKYARKETGIMIDDATNVMGYVEKYVLPGQKYWITTSLIGNCALVFYNNDTYLSDLNELGELVDYELTVPENATKMIVSNRYASTTSTVIKVKKYSYDGFADQVEKNTTNISDIDDIVYYETSTSEDVTVTDDYFLHYQTGIPISTEGSAYTIIDVEPGQKYRIIALITGNCGIVGFDNNDDYIFGFNYDNSGSYIIETNTYEVTIPDNVTKLGISTRWESTTPIQAVLISKVPYDLSKFAGQFDISEISERFYGIESRIGFAWRPFDVGKVIFMTDDTLSDIGVITSLLMNTYQFPMSYACITNTLNNDVDSNDNNYSKVKDVLIASQNFGGEVFSHSINSDDWSTDSTKNGGYDGSVPLDVSEERLRESKIELKKLGLKVNGFISPRGSSLVGYGEQVAQYYRYAYYQGSDIPAICHFTRTNIKSMTLSNLKNLIDSCALNKSLLVLMCHKVVDSDGEGYGIYPNGFTMSDFEAIMDYLKWGNDETKTIVRTDIDVTSFREVYNNYAGIQ